MKCPVCRHRLSIDLKRRTAACLDCGWNKNFTNTKTAENRKQPFYNKGLKPHPKPFRLP